MSAELEQRDRDLAEWVLSWYDSQPPTRLLRAIRVVAEGYLRLFDEARLAATKETVGMLENERMVAVLRAEGLLLPTERPTVEWLDDYDKAASADL